MRNLIFTIAYGKRKYLQMAEVLQTCIEKYSPGAEFKVFSDDDVSPCNLPYPRRAMRGKIEICASLKDPETRYFFIDCDSFVFTDVSRFFEYVKPNELIIDWFKSPNGKWSGLDDLDFPAACRKAGLDGIVPFQLNSGLLMWQGNMPAFSKALELFDKFDFDDRKGRRDDEYYICAGIQLTGANILSLREQSWNPVGYYWKGNLSVRDGRLCSDAYSEQKDVQHYGGGFWKNKSIRKVSRLIMREKVPLWPYWPFWK